MSDQMHDNLNRAAEAAGKAADQAADTVSGAAAQAADAAAQAAAKAADATQHAAEGAAKSSKVAVDELTQTVERIANTVADSARTAWESDQRKEIQDSIIKGLTGIAAAIEEQVKKLSETEDAKRFTAKMEETTDRISDQVRSSKTFQDIADGLMTGFSAAAASIEKWLGQQQSAGEQKGATPAAATDDEGAQNIVIESRPALAPPAAPPEGDDHLNAPDSTVHF